MPGQNTAQTKSEFRGRELVLMERLADGLEHPRDELVARDSDGLTPTERRVYKRLSDGRPRSLWGLASCLLHESADPTAVRFVIMRLRRKLAPRGVFIRTHRGYRDRPGTFYRLEKGEEEEFTHAEFRLMALLSDGQAHTREEMHACLEGRAARKEALQMHISRLRQKLASKGARIVCERGDGDRPTTYMLERPID